MRNVQFIKFCTLCEVFVVTFLSCLPWLGEQHYGIAYPEKDTFIPYQFCPKLVIIKSLSNGWLLSSSHTKASQTCRLPRELPSDWNTKILWILWSCLTSISITWIPPGAVDFCMWNNVLAILSHWRDGIFSRGEILMRRSAQRGSAFSSGSCYFNLFDVHKCTVSASKLELSDTIMNHVARIKVDLAIRLCMWSGDNFLTFIYLFILHNTWGHCVPNQPWLASLHGRPWQVLMFSAPQRKGTSSSSRMDWIRNGEEKVKQEKNKWDCLVNFVDFYDQLD